MSRSVGLLQGGANTNANENSVNKIAIIVRLKIVTVIDNVKVEGSINAVSLSIVDVSDSEKV